MSKTVPDEWVNGKFGDLARVQNGYAFKSSDFSERGHAAAIRMSNLKKGRIDLSDAKYVPERIVEGLDQFRLSEGDFLFGMSGSLDNYAWVTRDTGICYLNQRVGCLRAKPKSDSLYTAYCYLSETVKREIVGLAAGAAQLNISGSQLEAIPVPIPPLPEQQKIAAILSSVDDVIEKTRAQIDKLKDLKTGMMQELLTKGIGAGGVPHTEFKDSPVGRIPASWKVIPLEELCTKVSVGIASSTTHAYASSGVPLLRNQNILPNAIRYTDVLHISREFSDENESKKIREGDVLTVRTGYPGISAVVPKVFDGCHSFTTLISRPKKSLLNPHYLSLLINSDYGKHFVVGGQAGGAQQNLNATTLKTFPVLLPPLSEQVAIYDAANSISVKIALVEKKHCLLIDSKKALMQDLLTGKVRVKVDQKESAVA